LVWNPSEPNWRNGFPVSSFFLASKGFSENVAALAVSCWGIGGLTATFFGGWSADRIGRKPTLLAGLVLSAAAMLAMPWGNSIVLIDLCAFLAGSRLISNVRRYQLQLRIWFQYPIEFVLSA